MSTDRLNNSCNNVNKNNLGMNDFIKKILMILVKIR
jgi:hypothetical protein